MPIRRDLLQGDEAGAKAALAVLALRDEGAARLPAGCIFVQGVFDLSGTPATIRRPAPTLGQHTDEVLAEYLGFGQDELQRLREASVI